MAGPPANCIYENRTSLGSTGGSFERAEVACAVSSDEKCFAGSVIDRGRALAKSELSNRGTPLRFVYDNWDTSPLRQLGHFGL